MSGRYDEIGLLSSGEGWWGIPIALLIVGLILGAFYFLS